MEKIDFEEGLKALSSILEELKNQDLPLEEILIKTRKAKEIYEFLSKTLEEAKTVIEDI